jgi:hypothetical protein
MQAIDLDTRAMMAKISLLARMAHEETVLT